MAHQYSSAPSYGSQYPPAPFYSPFAPAAGQPVGSATPNFQQMSVHHQNLQNPSPVPNQTRYDSNAQVHPQPAPLPFPSQFNPELLKHFPPPPPIPPGHFAPVPGTMANLIPFPPNIGTPPVPIPQHSFNHFPQPTTPLSGVRSNAPVAAPSQDVRGHGQSVSPKEIEESNEQSQRPFSPAPALTDVTRVEAPTVQAFNGVVERSNSRSVMRNDGPPDYFRSHTTKLDNTNHQHGVAQQSSSLNHTATSLHTQPSSQPAVSARPPQSDLRERAKAALLSLVPHNIRYNDFLKEGVSASILQQLYDELGLNWRSQIDSSTKAVTETHTHPPQYDGSKSTMASSAIPVPAHSNSHAPSISKISPAVVSVSRSSPTASPGIERKDRIAQLLAAKTGKTAASAAVSQMDSPASATDSTPINSQETPDAGSHLMTVDPTRSNRDTLMDAIRQKMGQSRKEATFGGHDSGQLQASSQVMPPILGSQMAQLAQIQQLAPFQVTSLPTPIKEQIARSDFASLIPGLFMTSAETDEYSQFEQTSEDQQSSKDKTVLSDASHADDMPSGTAAYASQPTRKRSRSTDQSEEGEYHETKRHAAQTNDSADMDLDHEEASEGEIVEDEAEQQPQHREIVPPALLPGLTDIAVQSSLGKQSDDGIEQKHTGLPEQRQPIKRVQSYVPSPTGSTMSTPTVAQVPQTISSSPISKFPESNALTAKQEDRASLSSVSLVNMTPEQIKEKAAKAKEAFLRQRALRQRQLQEGIPFLNDEVVKTQTKLKEMKSQLAQIQGELREHEVNLIRAREAERKMQEEVQQLEKQISEGLSGQKQFSSELNELKQQTNNDNITQSSLAPVPSGQKTPDENEKPTEQKSIPQQQSPQGEDSVLDEGADNKTNVEHNGPKPFNPDVSAPMMHSRNVDPISLPLSEVDTAMEESPVTDTSMKEPPAIEASVMLTNEEVVVGDANDSDEAMEESDEESDDSRMSIDDDSNDSASMSDSGSDDYEPAEPAELETMHQDNVGAESEDYEPEVTNKRQFDNSQGDDGDGYEPAEDVSPDNASTATSDLVTTQSPSALGSTPGEHIAETPVAETARDVGQVSAHVEQSRVDDQEKDLQLSEANTLTKVQNLPQTSESEEPQVLGSDEVPSFRYVPYQSPLSSFRSYRFHPFFNEQVKDGYRSLTYSHKIDPKLPICLTELGGEACTDPECQDQHFGSMALTDDKILVQMSSANDIKDKPLRDQYLLGLKQVIARLRHEGVKEFSAVADALSQYRREWTAAQLTS